MKLKIDQQIFKMFPELKLGVIVIKSFDNSRRNSAVESLLRGVCAQRVHEFEEKELSGERVVQTWSAAFAKFGVNPKKFPPSIVALLKRVKSKKELPHINALVDLYNYFSLKHLLPIGGEDLDWLCGDLNLTFTKGKEAFRPIGEIDVEEAQANEIAYMDEGGITCRYFNYRECERTKFTEKTVNAALIIEDLSNMHMDKFGKVLEEIQAAVKKYLGGRSETYVLNEEYPSLEFGIQGRKTADDSKVPKQEKAHFLAVKNVKKPSSKKRKKAQKIQTLPFDFDSGKPNESPAVLKTFDDSLLINKIKSLLEVALARSFPQAPVSVSVEYPSSKDHGDYASNIALHLAKTLSLPPKDVAEKIVESLDKEDLIEKVEIAGPGFINFFVTQSTLDDEIEKILKEKEKYGSSLIGKEKTIVLDYSSPNIAKPLGAHHLLTTIIGQSLYNLYKFLGFNTQAVNHIGDWGTQFGKLICAYKKWGNKEEIEKDPIKGLLGLYVKFHAEAEKTPELEDEARHEFKIFEEGDKENRKLWQWFVEESLKDIEKTYDFLGGIHFDHVQGESFYEDKLEDILEEGKKRGVFVRGEEDAFVVKYDEEEIAPFVVQKKDGATLYSTRDFAALKYRINTWHPVKIIYVVDIAQTMHFKQLFKAAERFSWYHGEGVHVWFGRMHMKDGKASTRTGNVVLLDDLLAEAINRSKAIIEAKNPDLQNKEHAAHVIGVGAVKYNILSQNRTTDITFDWDKMLSLEANSSPYLQYAYTRAKSILRKAKNEEKNEEKDSNSFPDPSDAEEKSRKLTRIFLKFPEIIAVSAEEYRPNILTNYLYELAGEFNSFYNSVPVLRAENSETKEKRLKIIEAFSRIIKNGLRLLGIEVVEEM